MSIAKVIEVIAEGDTIEAAVEAAATEAGRTIKNIRSVYVKDIQALVGDGAVTTYRVTAKVTFVVN